MDWHCLGHATWLAEVSGLRLLFDPLLDDAHHGGVFEVFPPRTIDAEALQADFIFVSHRHPDHFDIESLRRLAAIDPETVVVTSDDIVASCAHRVGFQSVRVVPAETTINLDGPRLITSPSRGCSDPEWGVVVADADGVVYNQIDTSLGSPDDVRSFFARVGANLDRGTAEPLVTLALVRWQPLLEVEAMLAGAIGFPFQAYASELEHCAAIEARVLCPSAAGARHTGPYSFMNRLAYPLSEERFRRDALARMPSARTVPHRTGATYRVAGGDVRVDERGAVDAGLVTAADAPGDPREFRPLEIPAIHDPNLGARPEAELRASIEAWVLDVLGPSIQRGARGRSLRYVLEVVFPSTVDAYTIETGSGVVRRGDSDDWDVRCAVAGSLLVDVIEARRHWGDLLLGGMLRACSRACHVDAHGLRPIPLQPLFVYEAISYEQSILRMLERL